MDHVFLAPFPDDAAVDPAVTVVPVPWERTTSYGEGTRRGPEAILDASLQVELWDEELRCVPWMAGIDVVPPVSPLDEDVAATADAIAVAVEEVLDAGSFPVLLGGEHSLTPAAVRGARQRHDDLVVLQIDAHADLRESYGGDPWSHACAMARVRDVCPHVGVGIRALSRAEAELIREHDLPVWLASDCREPGWVDAVVSRLGELGGHVWITLDLDGFDPSVVPGVGTPEPGGLGWWQVLGLLRACCTRHTVVGADVVELLPREDDLVSAFAAARVTYRLIGYVLTAGGSRQCPRRLDPVHEVRD